MKTFKKYNLKLINLRKRALFCLENEKSSAQYLDAKLTLIRA